MKIFTLLFHCGKCFIAAILVVSLIMAICYVMTPASNERDWDNSQLIVSTITMDNDNLVTIKNMRDFDWSQAKDSDAPYSNYDNFQFNLSELKSVELAVSHFSTVSEIAHVFLMFELNEQRRFGFSIEARRTKDQKYSLLGGLFARFELINILASENDLIGLREVRNEKIYLYPTKATPEQVQTLFKLIMTRTNHLADHPELYHLFFKNCTTGVVDLVSHIADLNYSKLVQSFMPGNAGEAIYRMGLIDTDEPYFLNVKEAALVK